MPTADRTDPTSSLPASRKVLCLVYAAIAVVALVATWGPNLAYFPDQFFPDFINDLAATPASLSYTGDLLLLALAVVVFMVVEARKHAIRFVWLYIVGGFATAIAFTFPLFMIARELRLGASDMPRLGTVDIVLLSFGAVAVAGHLVWVHLA